MRTRTLLLIMCLLNSALIAQNKTRPNIIFNLADDMGYGDVKHSTPPAKLPRQT